VDTVASRTVRQRAGGPSANRGASLLSDDRALWLSRHVLPLEPALRAWLRSRRVAGLEIDDIVQETYARLIRARSVEGVRDVRTYTFQVAHSVVLSYVRRSRVVSFQALPDLESLGMASADPSPEQRTLDRDTLYHLHDAFSALPPRVREVLNLRRVEGLSQKEVARRLGISESTVEKHMSKGLYLLMRALTAPGEDVARRQPRSLGALRRGRGSI
jgi:RNA polymerase sigma factor (sigma-70 family)